MIDWNYKSLPMNRTKESTSEPAIYLRAWTVKRFHVDLTPEQESILLPKANRYVNEQRNQLKETLLTNKQSSHLLTSRGHIKVLSLALVSYSWYLLTLLLSCPERPKKNCQQRPRLLTRPNFSRRAAMSSPHIPSALHETHAVLALLTLPPREKGGALVV